MARPTTCDHDVVKQICLLIATSMSLRKACEQHDVAPSTFLGWVMADTIVAEQYTRAVNTGAEIGFNALDEIADEQPPNDQNGRTDAAWIAWQKLRIDTRKWTLARKAPKKYGERVDTTVTGADGGPVVIERIVRRITKKPDGTDN